MAEYCYKVLLQCSGLLLCSQHRSIVVVSRLRRINYWESSLEKQVKQFTRCEKVQRKRFVCFCCERAVICLCVSLALLAANSRSKSQAVGIIRTSFQSKSTGKDERETRRSEVRRSSELKRRLHDNHFVLQSEFTAKQRPVSHFFVSFFSVVALFTASCLVTAPVGHSRYCTANTRAQHLRCWS